MPILAYPPLERLMLSAKEEEVAMFKKHWIIILVLLPVLALGVSLYMQWRFLHDMHQMRQEYFLSNAKNAIDQAVVEVEREAVAHFVVTELEHRKVLGRVQSDHKGDDQFSVKTLDGRIRNIVSWGRSRFSDPVSSVLSDSLFLSPSSFNKDSRSLFLSQTQRQLLSAYLFHQEALNEVILTSIIDLDSGVRPSFDKISYNYLDECLKRSLSRVGVYEDFVIRIYSKNDQLVFERGPSHNVVKTADNSIRRTLFEKIAMSNMGEGAIEVIFYDHDRYLTTRTYAVPTIFATLVLLVLFVVALFFFFRQQRFERGRKDFVHNMTHELKTPVTSIKLASEMLDDDVLVQDAVRRHRLLGAMQSETKRLFFLVEKILQFTLVSEGKIQFNPTCFDANSILEDAVTVYSFKCEEKMGTMTADFGADNCYINVDKMHFQNVIFNVLDNAIKYSKPDVAPILEMKTSNPKPHILRIEVKDNGIGIARQDQKNIFRQYYRVDTGNVHDVKGFGLGLAYVSATVKSMKGRVWVESELGIGSTIIFELPSERKPKCK